MKNILVVLFLSILFVGCEQEAEFTIPEGRIESVYYPNSGVSNLYTDSEWRTFYTMQQKSFLTSEGFLEKRMFVIDSFTSPIPLTRHEAIRLGGSKNAEIVSTNYSTKEWFPSWNKNLSFEKETIRRQDSKVVLENEKGEIEMNFKEFIIENEPIHILIIILVVFCFVVFYILTLLEWKTRKDKRWLIIRASILGIICSFLIYFWSGAFYVELLLMMFFVLTSGFLFGLATLWFLKYKKQIKRQNQFKKVDTKPS